MFFVTKKLMAMTKFNDFRTLTSFVTSLGPDCMHYAEGKHAALRDITKFLGRIRRWEGPNFNFFYILTPFVTSGSPMTKNTITHDEMIILN